MSRKYEAEFNTFYQKSFLVLIKYFLRRVPKLVDAEDLTAETFIVIWENWEKIEKETRQNFLFGIARNKLNTYLRKKYQLEIRTREFDENTDLEIVSEQRINPGNANLKNILSELVNQLSEREQFLIKAKYMKHKTFRELAAELKITINNAKVIHNRLIKNLNNHGNK
ncbi:MAG: sigma-70 family RNA polymerase sigma factor [bacterium]